MLKRHAPLTYDNALSRAAGLCAKCEQCSPDIRKKLDAWGLTNSDSQRIIKRLEELRFLDDLRFAKAYAHDKLHFSGWGRRKIKQGLWVKRLDPSIIEQACEDFEDDDEAAIYRATVMRIMKAKIRQLKEWPLSREAKLKVVKFAMSRGFEYPLIVDIMRNNMDSLHAESDI